MILEISSNLSKSTQVKFVYNKISPSLNKNMRVSCIQYPDSVSPDDCLLSYDASDLLLERIFLISIPRVSNPGEPDLLLSPRKTKWNIQIHVRAYSKVVKRILSLSSFRFSFVICISHLIYSHLIDLV